MRPDVATSGLDDFEPQPWLDLFEVVYGLEVGGLRQVVLRRLLRERMDRLGMTRSSDYFEYVTSRAEGNRDLDGLVESVANRQTEFFRHRPSFEALGLRVLPRLLERMAATDGQGLALWSAGCATGEEAYSMAAVASDLIDLERVRVSVLGTDINPHALAIARRGRYSLRPEAVASLPGGGRLLEHRGPVRFEVRGDLRALVRFRQSNLCRPDLGWPVQMDVIFCHNVLIHVQPRLRPIIAESLYWRLSPGGFLCFAPGEVLERPAAVAEPVRWGETLMFRRAHGTRTGRATDAKAG